MKQSSKATIHTAHVSGSTGSKSPASPMASDWLASIRRPPLAARKRPSQFGAPNTVQKANKY